MIKKFLLQIGLFLMPLAILSLWANKAFDNALKKVHNYGSDEVQVWEDVTAGKINSELLIYGSSRAWTHIDPQILMDSLHTTAYNLGVDGYSFHMSYVRHRLLMKHNPKPKLILYSLDMFMLGRRPDLYNLPQFLPFMYTVSELKQPLLLYKGFKPVDFHLPVVRYYGRPSPLLRAAKVIITGTPEKPMRKRGYMGKEQQWDFKFEQAKAKMKSFRAEFDTSAMSLVHDFLQECKDSNIQVAFVYSPEYIEGQHFIENRNYIMQKFETLAKQYNIPMYDFSTDSICYDKGNFYNTTHMNATAATLFSSKLAHLMRKDNIMRKPLPVVFK